jgi:hypothetical protein
MRVTLNKRAAILAALVCLILSIMAQVNPFFDPVQISQAPAAAEGGSTNGTAGPPGFYSAISNRWSSGTKIALTSDAGSGLNRIAVACVSWYSSSATISSITNAGSFTRLTNADWYTDGNGNFEIWYQINPASGSSGAAVTFSSTPDEAVFHLLVITNAQQSGSFEVAATNNTTTTAISVSADSATNDLLVGYSTLANTPGMTVTYNGGATERSRMTAGAGTHDAAVSTTIGTNTTTTISFDWGDAGTSRGLIAVGVKGF